MTNLISFPVQTLPSQLPDGFDHQVDRIRDLTMDAFELATRDEILAVAKIMGLAIRCDQLVRSGAVPDATALARLAHVSQPRMTQNLNLTLLAPDIQEELLCLPALENGKPDVREKTLRKVSALTDWAQQRSAFSAM